jgi:hypothetical protein
VFSQDFGCLVDNDELCLPGIRDDGDVDGSIVAGLAMGRGNYITVAHVAHVYIFSNQFGVDIDIDFEISKIAWNSGGKSSPHKPVSLPIQFAGPNSIADRKHENTPGQRARKSGAGVRDYSQENGSNRANHRTANGILLVLMASEEGQALDTELSRAFDQVKDDA